jgi:hypothetical protein
MRQVTMVTLLVSIFSLIMQCSENAPLETFNGRMESVCDPFMYPKRVAYTRDSIIDTSTVIFKDTGYVFVRKIISVTDSVPEISDSIRWVSEFPAAGPSRVSIILSGKTAMDLEVETHTDSVPGTVPLTRTSDGVFNDTILIAASPLPGLILTTSSRLIVKKDGAIIGTIDLVNPHAIAGQ